MRHLKLYRWVAVLTLAIAVSPGTTSAQEADTLTITGTFHSAERVVLNGFEYPGTIGADLAEVYANSNENAWMLTLHGVAYSHDYYYYDGGSFYYEDYITRVGATSADFEFFGPDAGVLNEVVSQQLVGGFFELRNGYQDGTGFADENGPYRYLELGLSGEGVSFYVNGSAWFAQFSADEQGYPVLEPQLVWASYSTINDFRPGNSGGLVSFGDLMHIGSSEPPVLPPTMSVAGFPSPATAGVAGNFTVTLRDPSGNVATGYTGTVRFTSSDAKATLPANYTFTAADAGIHSFSAMLKTAGTQSITAADTLTSVLTATAGAITVNAAAASKFIMTAPSTVTAGVTFKLTLTVADAYANAVTAYIGTVRFTSTDNRAKLPANYSFTAADKGVHTFDGLVLRRKGKQKITITDTRKSALAATVVENVR